MQQHARGFAGILNMADTESFDVEFVAWTTENEVWLLGNHLPSSVLQREEIRCIIQHGTMPPAIAHSLTGATRGFTRRVACKTSSVLSATGVEWAI